MLFLFFKICWKILHKEIILEERKGEVKRLVGEDFDFLKL